MKKLLIAALLLIPATGYAKEKHHKGDTEVSCCRGELKEGDLKRVPPFKGWPDHIKVIKIDILERRCACIGIDHIPFKELKHKKTYPND